MTVDWLLNDGCYLLLWPLAFISFVLGVVLHHSAFFVIATVIYSAGWGILLTPTEGS
jgi:hypothetical protein